MILHVKERDGSTLSWVLVKPADFSKFLKSYPSLTSQVVFSRSVGDAVQKVADYLNRHLVYAWVEGNDLNKGAVRNAAFALGMGASLLSTPTMPDPSVSTVQQQVVQQPFGHRHEDAFLWNIKQIESSGGKDTAHKTMQHGIHRGESAVGRWGMMPKTVRDLTTRLKSLQRSTPETERLSTMGPDEMRSYLESRPEAELGLARFMARHLLQRHRGDEKRAAFSWLHGHNLYPGDITDENLNHDYVKRYEQFNTRNPLRAPATIKKAEKKPASFRDKLNGWVKFRGEYDNKPLPDGNFVPDPGRQRQDDLYEKPTGAQLIRQYVKDRQS